jgi:HSP20 family protein
MPRDADVDSIGASELRREVNSKDDSAATHALLGLDDKNVEVKLSNGTLTISGEKKEEKEEKKEGYYFSERRYGSF